MKPSTKIAAIGAAGVASLGVLTTSAQGATASPACSFTTHRLVVEFAHSYQDGDLLDQPLSVTAQGTKTCTLDGRAKVRLLDGKGHTLAYRTVAGAPGVTTEVGPDQQAVFDLTFGTGGHHKAPATVRITLPNGGGTRSIAWNSLTPTSETITVDGFRPWLD